MPTLLTSRPLSHKGDKASGLEGARAARAQQKPHDGSPMYVVVRTALIDVPAEPTVSPDGFYQERQASSCPASHIGRMKSLWEVESDGDSRTASRPPSPASDGSACTAPPPRMVVSLADSLGLQRRPPQEPARDGRTKTVAKREVTPPGAPAAGSPELLSLGSAGHAVGRCKPCAFFHSSGCDNGRSCRFCHACGADELKNRRKEKLQAKRFVQRLRRARAQAE